MEKIPEEDMKFLKLFPIVAHWIKNGKQLSDTEIGAYSRLYSEQMDIALSTSESKMLGFLNSYRHDRFYGKHIEVILSQEGTEWLRRTLKQIRQIRAENK